MEIVVGCIQNKKNALIFHIFTVGLVDITEKTRE